MKIAISLLNIIVQPIKSSNVCDGQCDSDPLATCIQTFAPAPAPGFICKCPDGYFWNSWALLMGIPSHCQDIDECSQLYTDDREYICDGTGEVPTPGCVNRPGSYDCVCLEGYEYDPVILGCVGKENSNACNGHCDHDPLASCNDIAVASGGIPFCECPDGYFWNSAVIPSFCEDACNGQCDHDLLASCNGTDVASGGTPFCGCPDGYFWNSSVAPPFCEDINECNQPHPEYAGSSEYSENICDGTGEWPTPACINRPGTYKCVCHEGYGYDPVISGCVNLHEAGSDVCDGQCFDPLATCIETATPPGGTPGFTCECLEGYFWSSLVAPPYCEDIDECSQFDLEGFNICDGGVSSLTPRCVNSPGSYDCVCSEGFEYDPVKRGCFDIDECGVYYNICNGSGANAPQCDNTYGSYDCRCATAGYEYDPTNSDCVDIDECANGTSGCEIVNGLGCTNLEGSFTCDIPPNSCDGKCIDWMHNLAWCEISYEHWPPLGIKCVCPDGFEWDQLMGVCWDLNECDDSGIGADVCATGTVCENTLGGFQCSSACENEGKAISLGSYTSITIADIYIQVIMKWDANFIFFSFLQFRYSQSL